MKSTDERRQQITLKIHQLLRDYYKVGVQPFDRATHRIPLSVPTYDADDVAEALDSLLIGWPTIGPKVHQVEDKVAKMLGAKHAIMLNSGGSANFLTLYLLSSPYARLHQRLQQGDEIITPAVTWSTTVSPILHVGCIPVLVDVNLGTYDIKIEEIEKNLTKRTKALMIVHALGHPCEMDEILHLCEEYDLVLIEDTCESFGAKYRDKCVGTFGHFGTFSFYFSHHVSSVEGGMIVTQDDWYADVLRSMRANGWLREIRDTGIRERITLENPDVDPRFLFPFTGFNLKPTDVAAGLLLRQIDRLEDLIKARTIAAEELSRRLQDYSALLYLPFQRLMCRHGWFCYPIVVKDGAPFSRSTLTTYLNSCRIDTRPVIAGNIASQPFLKDFKFRQGPLPNSDCVMKNGFFLGIHHLMGEVEIEYVADAFDKFFHISGNA